MSNHEIKIPCPGHRAPSLGAILLVSSCCVALYALPVLLLRIHNSSTGLGTSRLVSSTPRFERRKLPSPPLGPPSSPPPYLSCLLVQKQPGSTWPADCPELISQSCYGAQEGPRMNGFLLLLTVSLLVVVQVRAVPRAPAATTRFQLNGLIRFGEGMQVPGEGGVGGGTLPSTTGTEIDGCQLEPRDLGGSMRLSFYSL